MLRASLLSMKAAAQEYGWDLDFGRNRDDISEAACIIRAQFLHRIRKHTTMEPRILRILMLAPYFKDIIERYTRRNLRKVGGPLPFFRGIPVQAMSSAIAYFDS